MTFVLQVLCEFCILDSSASQRSDKMPNRFTFGPHSFPHPRPAYSLECVITLHTYIFYLGTSYRVLAADGSYCYYTYVSVFSPQFVPGLISFLEGGSSTPPSTATTPLNAGQGTHVAASCTGRSRSVTSFYLL